MKLLKQEKGFSLIELVVVISVVAILAAIGMPQINNIQRDSNTAKIVADLRSIDAAIAMYEIANGESPKAGKIEDSGLYPTESNAARYFVALPKPPLGDVYYATTPSGKAINKGQWKTSYNVQIPTGQKKLRGAIDIENTFYSWEYFLDFTK